MLTLATIALVPASAHQSFQLAQQRFDQMLLLLRPWARKDMLCNMVAEMEAKKVTVKCRNDGKDILWSSFTQFGLVNEPLTIIRAGGEDVAKHRVMFYDTDEQNVPEMNSQV